MLYGKTLTSNLVKVSRLALVVWGHENGEMKATCLTEVLKEDSSCRSWTQGLGKLKLGLIHEQVSKKKVTLEEEGWVAS